MRTVGSTFIVGAISLLLTSLDVPADQAQKPTPFVGYQMNFNGRVMGVPCTEWKITEIKADGDVVSTCRSYILESSGKNDFNPIKLSTMHGIKLLEFSPYAPVLKFPLAVGDHWNTPYTAFTADTGLIAEFVADCKVATYESVTVPAGALQAFRIECADKWTIGAHSGLFHTTRWYSPEAAGIIKSDNKEEPAKWNFELASYGLAGSMSPTAAAPATAATPAATTGSSGNLDQVAPIKGFDEY